MQKVSKIKLKLIKKKSAKELLIMLEAANKTIADLKNKLGGKIPMSVEDGENTSMNEASVAMIEELKEKLE